MKLQESLQSLLLEVASIESIQPAIKNKKVCIIYYMGDTPGGEGEREIEPVALGRSKAGNLVLRAWQREGSSHTVATGEKIIPGWRFFRLDKMARFTPTEENFTEKRPGYNDNGDKSMKSIILIAKF